MTLEVINVQEFKPTEGMDDKDFGTSDVVVEASQCQGCGSCSNCGSCDGGGSCSNCGSGGPGGNCGGSCQGCRNS